MGIGHWNSKVRYCTTYFCNSGIIFPASNYNYKSWRATEFYTLPLEAKAAQRRGNKKKNVLQKKKKKKVSRSHSRCTLVTFFKSYSLLAFPRGIRSCCIRESPACQTPLIGPDTSGSDSSCRNNLGTWTQAANSSRFLHRGARNRKTDVSEEHKRFFMRTVSILNDACIREMYECEFLL